MCLQLGEGSVEAALDGARGDVESLGSLVHRPVQEVNASPLAAIHFAIPATDANHSAGIWTIGRSSAFPVLGDTTTIGVSGWPSRIVSINPIAMARKLRCDADTAFPTSRSR